jgi:hypothetical protein
MAWMSRREARNPAEKKAISAERIFRQPAFYFSGCQASDIIRARAHAPSIDDARPIWV